VGGGGWGGGGGGVVGGVKRARLDKIGFTALKTPCSPPEAMASSE